MRRLRETAPSTLVAYGQRLAAERGGSTAIPGGPKRLPAGRGAGSIGRACNVQAEAENRGARLHQAPSQGREDSVSPNTTGSLGNGSLAGSIRRYGACATPAAGADCGLLWDAGQHGQHGDEFTGRSQREAPPDMARTVRARSAAILCRRSTPKF
jgi:hypothetical protein